MGRLCFVLPPSSRAECQFFRPLLTAFQLSLGEACTEWGLQSRAAVFGHMSSLSYPGCEDRSMFELFIDLATGRQRVEEIDPLEAGT